MLLALFIIKKNSGADDESPKDRARPSFGKKKRNVAEKRRLRRRKREREIKKRKKRAKNLQRVIRSFRNGTKMDDFENDSAPCTRCDSGSESIGPYIWARRRGRDIPVIECNVVYCARSPPPPPPTSPDGSSFPCRFVVIIVVVPGLRRLARVSM